MMRPILLKLTAVIAPVIAFFGSCCALPLLLAGLGMGSMGIAAKVAPYRPYMIGATGLLLAIAFYASYSRGRACAHNDVCDLKRIRRTRILLWAGTILALIFLLGPELVAYFLLK